MVLTRRINQGNEFARFHGLTKKMEKRNNVEILLVFELRQKSECKLKCSCSTNFCLKIVHKK